MTSSSAGKNNEPQRLAAAIKAEARRLGFDLVGVAPAVTPTGFGNLQEWLRRGYAGHLDYIGERRAAYEHPKHLLESVRSVVMLAVGYRTTEPRPTGSTGGLVSRYAWGEADYHDLLRTKLRQLADFAHQECPGCRTRGVVDTAPLLEREFARLAGLGWVGKNTMLINKRLGSWLFLAALLVDIELEPDAAHETSHCGKCTRCLEACPTGAFPEPFVLDARKCISYLTIELRDAPIPMGLREAMGQWLFGCDVCQEVCPWNRKAPVSDERAFQPLADLNPADARELLSLSNEQFHDRFHHSPLARPKRAGLLRNAAIVLGNPGDQDAVSVLVEALTDAEPLIRGAAAWALGRLGGEQSAAAIKSRLAIEENADVLEEVRAAIRTIETRASD